jgi:hypothetical protein
VGRRRIDGPANLKLIEYFYDSGGGFHGPEEGTKLVFRNQTPESCGSAIAEHMDFVSMRDHPAHT